MTRSFPSAPITTASSITTANLADEGFDLSPLPKNLPKLMQRYYRLLEQKPRLNLAQQKLVAWDTKLCVKANLLSHSEIIAKFFKAVSRLGDGWFWAIATLSMTVLCHLQGQAGGLVAGKTTAVLLTSFCGYLLYKFLKVHTVRPRPYQVHQVIKLGERPLDVFSFPSGHTLQAVLFTIMLGSQLPMLLWVLVPFTVLIAISRMVLGLHYPTDVLMGAGIGALFATIGTKVTNYLLV